MNWATINRNIVYIEHIINELDVRRCDVILRRINRTQWGYAKARRSSEHTVTCVHRIQRRISPVARVADATAPPRLSPLVSLFGS